MPSLAADSAGQARAGAPGASVPAMPTDRHDLARFVAAQDGVYESVLAELRAGRKTGHWMWFVFPQLAGLGHSPMAQAYAIRSADQARAYIEHPILGPRLRECCQALLAVEGQTVEEILGSKIDVIKLRSSMTLFQLAGPDEPLFGWVLARFYHGRPDDRTLAILGQVGPQA